MKVINLALLGTAALVAASVGARAENLDALKTQMDTLTLNAVADAPAAATTTIVWTGYVRGAVTTFFDKTRAVGNQYGTDIRAKAGFKVVGTTDTAVGEVGVRIATQATATDGGFQANVGNGAIRTDGFWGYWKLTPNVQLGAGVDGSLGKTGQGFDAKCSTAYVSCFGGISNNANGDDPAQIRLSYADGPLGFAVAVEDSNNSVSPLAVGFLPGNNNNASAIGVAARASYSADIFSGDLGGAYWGNAIGPESAWVVSGGVGASFGIASLSIGAGIGSGFAVGDDYTSASAIMKVNLGDTAHAELGAGHRWNTSPGAGVNDFTTLGAGLYYDPVKQITVGAEGVYISGGPTDGSYGAALFTVFRF